MKIQHCVCLFICFTMLIFLSGVQTQKNVVGSSCSLPGGKLGKCVRQSNAPYATCNANYAPVYLCDNDTTDGLIVCYHKEDPSPSMQACNSYMNHHTRHATTSGDPINILDYPYLAALGFLKQRSDSEEQWLCSAVLISEKYCLSVAHCATDPENGQLTRVRLGNPNELSSTYLYDVAKLIPHPDYRYPHYYNDIALVEIRNNVMLDQVIWPICLSNTDITQESGKDVKVLGWKSSYEEVVPPLTIPENITQTIIDRTSCSEQLDREFLDTIGGRLHESMFCGISNTSDTCRGDSGSPVVKEVDNRHYLLGLTSFGYDPCGGRPSVYVNVPFFLEWIECKAWPLGYNLQ